MTMSNNGKASEAFFQLNVKGLVFRLRDKADMVGLNGGKNVAAFGNPSDYFLVTTDSGYLAEVKSSSSTSSFSLSGFTKAQLNAIYKCSKLGYGDKYRIYIHSLHLNQWYLMDANQFMAIIKQGKKSIKWTELNTLTSW